ncbi:MAG TPA: hypothetical protein VFQ44_24305 [Streptosporangiaceae bacterium]|nr:hypothetical protein [Streptosporangiaceae bacterium]
MSHTTVIIFVIVLFVVVAANIFRSFRRTTQMIKRGPDWTPVDGFNPARPGSNVNSSHHAGAGGHHGHGHHGHGHHGGVGGGGVGGGHHGGGGGGGGDAGGGHHH